MRNSNKDDDTITRGELRKALQGWRTTRESPVTFGGYYSVTSLVDDVFREAQGKSDPPFARGRDEDNCGEMTVTLGELTAALNRLHYVSPQATVIFDDIKANREPAWKPFDVVIDANRVVWQRTLTGLWQRFGGTGLHGDSTLARPLKRMTEES